MWREITGGLRVRVRQQTQLRTKDPTAEANARKKLEKQRL